MPKGVRDPALQAEAQRIAEELVQHGVSSGEDNGIIRVYVAKIIGNGTYTTYWDTQLQRLMYIDKAFIRQQFSKAGR